MVKSSRSRWSGLLVLLVAGVLLLTGIQPSAAAGVSDLDLRQDGWGRGWVWLGNDGLTICLSSGCYSLFTIPQDPTPQPTKQPEATAKPEATAEPEATPQIKVLGKVPLQGQTKYVSCELRTTASNVEWYYLYRQGVDPATMLPEGYSDFEAYFIDRTGQHCNPNRGFRGDINGRFVTACDPAAGGYGVYPRPIEKGLDELGIPYRTYYYEVNAQNEALLKELFASAYENQQVLSLWVRQIVDAPITWEVDPETGERYPIATHEHAVSGQVVRSADGTLVMRVVDPWPMYTGVQYTMTFDDIITWMTNLGMYMLQVIG